MDCLLQLPNTHTNNSKYKYKYYLARMDCLLQMPNTNTDTSKYKYKYVPSNTNTNTRKYKYKYKHDLARMDCLLQIPKLLPLCWQPMHSPWQKYHTASDPIKVKEICIWDPIKVKEIFEKYSLQNISSANIHFLYIIWEIVLLESVQKFPAKVAPDVGIVIFWPPIYYQHCSQILIQNIARGTTDPWVDTITGGTL